MHFRALSTRLDKLEERLETRNGTSRAYALQGLSSEELDARLRHLLQRLGVPADRVDEVNTTLANLPADQRRAWLRSFLEGKTHA